MQYIIIVGCGMLGQQLAQEFSEQHNVVIVDKNPRALEILGDDFNGKKVLGDALDLSVLEQAGIKNADILLLVTGNDSINIVIGRAARKIYGVKKVALQVNNVHNKKIFSEEGLIIVNKNYLLVEVFRKCLLS